VNSLDVVIVVPVLRRPHRVKPLLENIAASTPEGSYRVLFVATADDTDQVTAILEAGEIPLLVGWEGGSPGDFSRKTNAGYLHSTEPLILTGADDLNFHPGWLEAAKAKMKPGIGVVGTMDGGNPAVKRGLASTHSLVKRSYADLGGSVDASHMIYCEEYPHQWVDNELVETAKARGAFAFAKDSRVAHLHPHWNKGEHDEVYAIGDQALEPSRKVYQQRQKLWRGKRLPRFEG
jgi:hypothetical protein